MLLQIPCWTWVGRVAGWANGRALGDRWCVCVWPKLIFVGSCVVSLLDSRIIVLGGQPKHCMNSGPHTLQPPPLPTHSTEGLRGDPHTQESTTRQAAIQTNAAFANAVAHQAAVAPAAAATRSHAAESTQKSLATAPPAMHNGKFKKRRP